MRPCTLNKGSAQLQKREERPEAALAVTRR